MPTPDAPSNPKWHFHAALGAWLLPGLGHYILGQRQRGAILAATIGSLWLGGLLIGGIDVINRTDHTAWFIGQVLIAPSVAIDVYRAYALGQHPMEPGPDNDPPYELSFGRVEEQGILYTALAGLLNLLAAMDVLYCDPAQRRQAERHAQVTTRLARPGAVGDGR